MRSTERHVQRERPPSDLSSLQEHPISCFQNHEEGEGGVEEGEGRKDPKIARHEPGSEMRTKKGDEGKRPAIKPRNRPTSLC